MLEVFQDTWQISAVAFLATSSVGALICINMFISGYHRFMYAFFPVVWFTLFSVVMYSLL